MSDTARKVKAIRDQVGIASRALDDTKGLTGPGKLKLMVAAARVCESAVRAMESIQLSGEMAANRRQIQTAVSKLAHRAKA